MMYLAGAVYLLKLTLGLTVAGSLVTVSTDKDVHRFVKWVGKGLIKDMQTVKGFELENSHCTVIGLTQHGKTHATIKTLERINKAVLFFNTQHTPIGKGWVTATAKNTPKQIIDSLKKGNKVCYYPMDESIDKMSVELGVLTSEIYKLGNFDFYFAVDEVHLFWMGKKKEGKEALLRLATTGLGRGFKMIFLSQRPAKVDNTLYTQSTKHIIFALGKMDEVYLKNGGFPVEEIVEKTKNEKYRFVEFDQKEVKGAYIIG